MTEKLKEDKWYRLAQKHCDLYYPSFVACMKQENKTVVLKTADGRTVDRVDKLYYCPLCLNSVVYIIDDEITWGSEFDEDHYPPDSVGGKSKLLVCKSCNSTGGKDIDFSLKEYHEYVRFQNRKGSLDARITLDGIVSYYRMKVKRGDTAAEVKFEDENKNRYVSQKLNNLLSRLPVDEYPQFKVTFKEPAYDKMERALLKAAYLKFFSVMGYDFAFSSVGRMLHAVITGATKHVLSNNGVMVSISQSYKEGIYAVFSPKHLRGFFVVLSTQLEAEEKALQHLVVIPVSGELFRDRLNAYEVFDEKKEAAFYAALLPEEVVEKAGLLKYTALSGALLDLPEE